jgi:hypothetical protein
MEKLAQKAATGNVDAIRVVLDRKLGRIPWSDEQERPSQIFVVVNTNRPRDVATEERARSAGLASRATFSQEGT